MKKIELDTLKKQYVKTIYEKALEAREHSILSHLIEQDISSDGLSMITQFHLQPTNIVLKSVSKPAYQNGDIFTSVTFDLSVPKSMGHLFSDVVEYVRTQVSNSTDTEERRKRVFQGILNKIAIRTDEIEDAAKAQQEMQMTEEKKESLRLRANDILSVARLQTTSSVDAVTGFSLSNLRLSECELLDALRYIKDIHNRNQASSA